MDSIKSFRSEHLGVLLQMDGQQKAQGKKKYPRRCPENKATDTTVILSVKIIFSPIPMKENRK